MAKANQKKIAGKILAAALVLSVVLLAGCQQTQTNGQSSNTASLASDYKGTITITGWNKMPALFTQIATQFKTKYPNVTINTVLVDSTYTKLYAQLAAGTDVPDINDMQRRDVKSFMNKFPNAWADVTSWVKPIEKNIPEAVTSDVKDSKGKYKAFPWDIAPCATYYRTDMFQKAGVDPASLTTWDKFVDAAKKIQTANPGVSMLGLDWGGASDQNYEIMLLNELGGSFYDSNGKVNFANPKCLQMLNELLAWKNAGITMNLPNYGSDIYTTLNANKLATDSGGEWLAAHFCTSVPDGSGKWSLIPLPAFTEGGNNQAQSGGSALAVSAKSKCLPLACAFAKYVALDSEGLSFGWNPEENASIFPSNSQAYKDDAGVLSKQDPYFNMSVGEFFEKLTSKIPPEDFGEYYTDVNNALQTVIGNILVKGEDPKTAAQEGSQAAQRAIDNE